MHQSTGIGLQMQMASMPYVAARCGTPLDVMRVEAAAAAVKADTLKTLCGNTEVSELT